MNEERELAARAWRRIRSTDHPMLLVGLSMFVVGLAATVIGQFWADEATGGTGYLSRLWRRRWAVWLLRSVPV